LLTMPYVPLLFAGVEWGASSPFHYFIGHASRELAAAVLHGRREEFGHFGWAPEHVPDPQDPATFLASKLDWSERNRAPHADVLAWYRALLTLRAATPALRDGDRAAVVVRHDAAAGWIVVERGPISVAANLGTEPADVPIRGDLRLAWPASHERNAGSVRLPPDGVVVVERDP